MKRLLWALASAGIVATLLCPSTVSHSAHAAAACETASNNNIPPPANFVPLTASDAELACYGIPARPSDPHGLAAWTNFWKAATHWIPSIPVQVPLPRVPGAVHSSALVQPQFGTQSSTNWAGYAVQASDQTSYPNLQYWQVMGYFTQEAPAQGNGCPLSNWAGLGGWYTPSQDIVQAGTQMYDLPGGTILFFYQDYPLTQQTFQLGTKVGDNIEIDVAYYPTTHTATYVYLDQTTGAFHPYSNMSTPDDLQVQTVAEVIFEDNNAIYGNYYPPFNTVQFGTEQNGLNQVSGYTNYNNQNTWQTWQLTQQVTTTIDMNDPFNSTQYAVPTGLNYLSEFNVCPGGQC
jgi:hypothetical protein